MKQLNNNKTRFLRFDKILVIQPIAEVYGEGNERQLCYEIEYVSAVMAVPIGNAKATGYCYFFVINSFLNKPWFLCVCSTSLLKTQWDKEKLLVTSNFSFSHSVFLPFGELSAIFIKFEIVICRLFQFGRV